jgi:hypothetical protein
MLTKKPLSLFIMISLSVCFYAQSQNLVPNGSFEEGNFCPEFLADLHLGCANWYAGIQAPGTDPNYNPSPDWFHTCAPNFNLQPPGTVLGFQEPYEGNGYAGIATYSLTNSNYRELISVQLLQDLIIGEMYTASFKVNRSNRIPQFAYASNNMGLKFTTYPFFFSNDSAISNWSHYVFEEIIVDTVNWIVMNVDFIADSSYQFMHLGNFYDDQNTTTEYYFEGQGGANAYYFIDDVQLHHNPSLTQINSKHNKVTISPNPTSHFIEISGEVSIEGLTFFDGMGRIVLTIQNDDSQNRTFDLSYLTQGMYVVNLEFTDQASFSEKIVIIN